MDFVMKYQLKMLAPIAGMLFLTWPVLAVESNVSSNKNEYCYSAYNLQQQLDLTVNFGASTQHQKTKVDVDLHVREIPVSAENQNSLKSKKGKLRELRSYVVFVRPNRSNVNGVDMDRSKHYRHPFLVIVDAGTGEILDLKSTSKTQSVLDEYFSFFDLFQYSKKQGEYHYRNGNGFYLADINYASNNNSEASLIKKNHGYLNTSNKNKSTLQVKDNLFFMQLAKSQTECFYKKAKGNESFKSNLSKEAYVEGRAKIIIESDLTRALPGTHFFYTLTDDLKLWPSYKQLDRITKKEAFAKLPFLMARLSSSTEDDSKFLKEMLADISLWPYLAEYILQNELSDELSIQLFWALDRIDTTESVSALVSLVTSPLSARDHLRSVLALGSTSASFDDRGITALKEHMANYSNPGFYQSKNLTFVRMLGAMASNRNITEPMQSSEIKEYLYSQAGVFDESVNAAVIDAIGNLKDSIDSEGETILLQGVTEGSNKVRQSAASAFKRVPYKSEYSDVFIEQLANESSMEIKYALVDVMGRTDNTDGRIKHQLLSLLKNSSSPTLKNKSLGSLKKVGYIFQDSEITLLESQLRYETDRSNQKILASLILKHRRNDN